MRKTSGIGCQGVIEGIILSKDGQKTVSIRKADGQVIIEKKKEKKDAERAVVFRIPLLRGIAVFFDRLVWGAKNLFYSSTFSEDEEKQEQKKPEEPEAKDANDGSGKEFVAGLALFAAFVAAAGLFMMLPYFLSTVFEQYIKSAMLYTLLESGIRLVIFLAFLAFVSRRPAMKRVFMYQAAGHKLINCIEGGLKPEPANIRVQSRKNRDSSSSFLLYVFFVSIILFMFVQVEISWLRVVVRLCIIPAVAAVLYEIGNFARKSRCGIANFLNVFRMAMQGAVVAEPEEEMILVAAEAGKKALDWKKIQKELEAAKKEAAKEVSKENVSENEVPKKGEETAASAAEMAAGTDDAGEEAQEISDSKVINFAELKKQSRRTLEEAAGKEKDGEKTTPREFTKHKVVKHGVRGKAGNHKNISFIIDPGEEERQKDARWREQMQEFGGDEEEDEILSALDRFFDEKDE